VGRVNLREELKWRLLQERGDTCDYCGEAGATDMHEWLIKRGAVPKGRKQLRIFDERNCSLLHHTCHLVEGQTKEMKRKLARVFLERYGLEALIGFVEELGLRDPSHLQFLKGVVKDMDEEGYSWQLLV